jgi:hypothetical protein
MFARTTNRFGKLLGIFCLSFLTQVIYAAPAAKAITFWMDSNEASSKTINHDAWQGLLDKYLISDPNGVNRFKYGTVPDIDRKALKHYIKTLEGIDPRRYNRNEQMAYWINLYNALTVNVVLDAYPVKSILKIGGSLFSPGPWNEKYLNITGQKLSLNDVEHGILRPIWQDSRIHYAVNCASYSCPNLSAMVFTAGDIDNQLSKAAKAYVNNPRGITVEGKNLLLSKIFDWYKTDFGANEKELLRELAKHAEPALAKRLAKHNGDIDYEYDWDLNEEK